MTTLTPELKQAIEQAGEKLVRLKDPHTRQAYVVLKAEVYENIREFLGDRWQQAAIPRQALGNVDGPSEEGADAGRNSPIARGVLPGPPGVAQGQNAARQVGRLPPR